MNELSYQEQLYQIVVQTNSSSKTLNNNFQLNKPYPCLSSFMSQKMPIFQSSHASLSRVKFSKIKQNNNLNEQNMLQYKRDHKVYEKLLEQATYLKNKKLVNTQQVKNIANSVYEAIEIDLQYLREVLEILRVENKQLMLNLEGVEIRLSDCSEYCVGQLIGCEEGEELNKFIQTDLRTFQKEVEQFISIIIKQLPRIRQSYRIGQVLPYNLPTDDYSLEEYRESVLKLVEVLTKVQEIITSEFKKYSQQIQVDSPEALSIATFEFIHRINEILIDMSQFCMGEQSLMNRVLYYGFKIKNQLIQKMSLIYKKYVCSGVQNKIFFMNAEEQGMELDNRGILTQIHIQIYKYHLFYQNKFYEKNFSKIKTQMGSIMSELMQILRSTQHAESTIIGNLKEIHKKMMNLSYKEEYLKLLLTGVKTVFLQELLGPMEKELIWEFEQISSLSVQISEFISGGGNSLGFEYWKTNCELIGEIRAVRQSLEEIKNSDIKDGHVVIERCENCQMRMLDLQQKIEEMLNIFRKKAMAHNSTRRPSKIIQNCCMLLQAKSKQINSLKQKLLIFQFDIYQEFGGQLSSLQNIQNSPEKSMFMDDKNFESRAIEEESHAQIPQDFKKSLSFIRSVEISRISRIQSAADNYSLNNSNEIEIPVSNRQANEGINLTGVLRAMNRFEVNADNFNRCSHLLSETSQFFQERVKKLLVNGYHLYFYQSGNDKKIEVPKNSNLLNFLTDEPLYQSTNRNSSQNRHRQSTYQYHQYSKRLETLLKEVNSYISDFSALIQQKGTSLFEPPLQQTNSGLRSKIKGVNRQSEVRIEVGEDSEDEGTEEKKNMNSNLGIDLSVIRLKGEKEEEYGEELIQLRLSAINLFLLRDFLILQEKDISPKKQQPVPVSSPKLSFQPIKKQTPLLTIVTNHLNFEFQNWKQNIQTVQYFIKNNLEGHAKVLKQMLTTYPRSVFSECLTVYRDAINLIEIFVDILSVMVLVYRACKEKCDDGFSFSVIRMDEEHLSIYSIFSQYLLKMEEQAQQLHDFRHIPHSIRTYLYQIYCLFIQNFKQYIGYPTHQHLQSLIQKLTIAMTFKNNHENIFEVFLSTLYKNIELYNKIGTINTNSNSGKMKIGQIGHIIREINEVSEQILMIRSQNIQICRIDEQRRDVSIQGLNSFNEINEAYSQYYRLGEYIVSKGQRNYKSSEIKLKKLKEAIKQIYQAAKKYKIIQ